MASFLSGRTSLQTLNTEAPFCSGKMLNGVRRMDPVSERARRELRDAERERFEIASQTHRLPTRTELGQLRPGLADARMQAYAMPPLSLDRKLPDDLEATLDIEGDPAFLHVCRADRALLALIRSLLLRQQRVIALHYYGERSMRDIGDTWKISGSASRNCIPRCFARFDSSRMPRRFERDLERTRAELASVLHDPLAVVGPDAELETPCFRAICHRGRATRSRSRNAPAVYSLESNRQSSACSRSGIAASATSPSPGGV